jgi:aryl-alcohol dehydrogenase-like predicted oxidoreductase
MKTRQLGQQGLKVSELGLGCMGLSDFYSSSGATEAQGIELIHRALALGVTFLDTADVYGPHSNEVTVGKALRGKRESVVLATKFGIVREPGSNSRGVSGKPEYVRACCEASLRRLGVDVIDLYYQHRVDPQVPIPGTTSPARLEENVHAPGVALSAADLQRIDSVAPRGVAVGTRYHPSMMRLLNG